MVTNLCKGEARELAISVVCNFDFATKLLHVTFHEFPDKRTKLRSKRPGRQAGPIYH